MNTNKTFIILIGLTMLIVFNPLRETTYTSKDIEVVKAKLEEPVLLALDSESTMRQQLSTDNIQLIATVYHAVPEQCNNDPEHTASMFKLDLSNPYRHKVIAVSRDLLEDFPYGTKVELSGVGYYNGIYTVEDTMNKRYNNRIDILINIGMPIGKWSNVKLIKIS